MLRFFSSLSFLYLFTIAVLLVYAWLHARNFQRPVKRRKIFPLVFFIVAASCFAFLWINFHAPLSLRTFSNLDHNFLRHDGFAVKGKVELGNADTVNIPANSYNRFIVEKRGDKIELQSPYAEEPLYIAGDNGYKIASTNFPAAAHSINFLVQKWRIKIITNDADKYELRVNDSVYVQDFPIKKGTNAWTIFKDADAFINSPYYTEPVIATALQQVFLLRDNVTRRSGEDLKYFLTGRLLKVTSNLQYDNTAVKQLAFSVPLDDDAQIAWGVGFLYNNRNQFHIKNNGSDSFSVLYRYPVAYPLTEEVRDDWSPHPVNKFLLSNSAGMQQLPPFLTEGFLFNGPGAPGDFAFAPLLLGYSKAARNEDPLITVRKLQQPAKPVAPVHDGFLVPALTEPVNWIFSVQNTYDWQFDQGTLLFSKWQWILFGSLAIYFFLIMATALLHPAVKQSWVWQLICTIALVLLTTRFFLYWRYKSFPPFEGMDLPSQQQLGSTGNFYIIVAATLMFGIVLGFGCLRSIYKLFGKKNVVVASGKNPGLSTWFSHPLQRLLAAVPVLSRLSPQVLFFGTWFFLLLVGGAFAAINHFDAGVSRHLAIAFILIYFLFLFQSYRYSPLVIGSEKAWWRLGTGRALDIVINNPVKIILSVCLLALFVFIDIGFAIVFLNFLLFNEAFLCINYGIAGLSAGGKRNARLFAVLGGAWLILFVLNLLYAPQVFRFLLALPNVAYTAGYFVFGISLAYTINRLLTNLPVKVRRVVGFVTAAILFLIAFFFFPKERILEKAAMTKYRIDVLTAPAAVAIGAAYEEGKTYEPVIRAAQNQWFINTFIDEENNPGVQEVGFNLLPHAPQNKGAKYNAQATDLVTSRFFIAEHGKWSVLLYVLLLILPALLLASFYKLYPDFTNRVNKTYPVITIGFSLLNYLLITALLVILAATGRYIFFGQDLPFGSILSKQSILFPAIILLAAVLLFRKIPLEQYRNRRKLIPGVFVFSLLAILLFFVRPAFNKNKEFGIAGLSQDMDNYIQENIQPVMDYYDTAKFSRHFSPARKDKLFTDSLRLLLTSGVLTAPNKFFISELTGYSRSVFARHLDQRRLLYLDLNSGAPRLGINANYFRVEAPPHLQVLWTGNLYGNNSSTALSFWNRTKGNLINEIQNINQQEGAWQLTPGLKMESIPAGDGSFTSNLSVTGNEPVTVRNESVITTLQPGTSYLLTGAMRLIIRESADADEKILVFQPSAFMRNFYVNGSRYYDYPLGNRFNWARNMAEAVSPAYSKEDKTATNVFLSLDYPLMDSLTGKIRNMLLQDTAYKANASYGICIADANGRLLAIADYMKGMERPDPNNKAAFNKILAGENGIVSQSLLRKQIGNINLLRMNPGPGSTLKPIVFSAIASQLNLDWEQFASSGLHEKQHFYGGEKVSEYDFEKDNGRVSTVSDYLKYSDNYYHSNILLLGSYPKQSIDDRLFAHFSTKRSDAPGSWPNFEYKGNRFYLDGFKNWPAYENGTANFGSDSSFTSVGMLENFGIYNRNGLNGYEMFKKEYDSSLYAITSGAGFIAPEYSLFDQYGDGVNHRNAYDLFTSCFKGHVKGSSQVMISPAKMVEAYGKLVSQNTNYALTLNPNPQKQTFKAFSLADDVNYPGYMNLVHTGVFAGMHAALFNGTAARLGAMLTDGTPYYYFGKTGTTGDDQLKSKSKLFTLIISAVDLQDPDVNFRDNQFMTIYFTSQNGPAKQNEEFQAEIIRFIESTQIFRNSMGKKKGQF